jgi:glycerol-3-phosphate acyltransferase PlsY
MNPWFELLGAVLVAYLLGAVPFGFLIGRARGVDIRQQGSRNIGATNVGRVLGRRWGLTCLALDIAKGLLPTAAYGWLCVWPVARQLVAGQPTAAAFGAWLSVAVAAVLGHLFPVYLGFRGGKGVATTIGVALGLYPYYAVPMALAIVGYAVARKLTGVVSFGSLVIAVAFPALVFGYTCIWRGLALAQAWPLLAVAVLLGLMIIVRHKENIRRLLQGHELSVRAADEHRAENG